MVDGARRRLNEQNAHLMDVVKDAHRKNSRREAGPIVGEQREQVDSNRRALRSTDTTAPCACAVERVSCRVVSCRACACVMVTSLTIVV